MMIPEKMYLKNFPGIIYELSKRYCDVINDRGFLIKEAKSMKQEEIGIVIEAEGEFAKVRAARHGDCKECGACPGDDAITMDVQNPISAKVGQRVTFEMHEASMVTAAFVVYALPLLAAAAGAIIGWYIAGKFGQAVVPFQIGGGIIGFGLSLIFVKLYDRAMKKNTETLPVITKILS